MTKGEIKSKVEKFLAEDEIGLALKELLQFFEGHTYFQDFIIQSASFKRLQNATVNNLINWQEINITRNMIIKSLFELTELAIENKELDKQSRADVEEQFNNILDSIDEEKEKKNKRRIIRYLLGILSIGIIMVVIYRLNSEKTNFTESKYKLAHDS